MKLGFKTSKNAAYKLSIAMRLEGESCPYCGHKWTRGDANADLVTSDVDYRPAHRGCWEKHLKSET